MAYTSGGSYFHILKIVMVSSRKVDGTRFVQRASLLGAERTPSALWLRASSIRDCILLFKRQLEETFILTAVNDCEL